MTDKEEKRKHLVRIRAAHRGGATKLTGKLDSLLLKAESTQLSANDKEELANIKKTLEMKMKHLALYDQQIEELIEDEDDLDQEVDNCLERLQSVRPPSWRKWAAHSSACASNITQTPWKRNVEKSERTTHTTSQECMERQRTSHPAQLPNKHTGEGPPDPLMQVEGVRLALWKSNWRQSTPTQGQREGARPKGPHRGRWRGTNDVWQRDAGEGKPRRNRSYPS